MADADEHKTGPLPRVQEPESPKHRPADRVGRGIRCKSIYTQSPIFGIPIPLSTKTTPAELRGT